MFLKPISYLSLLLFSTSLLLANDTGITKTKSLNEMSDIIENGTHKQKLFLALNPNISDKILEQLLDINNSVITSTVKDNKRYKEYMDNKAYLKNLKQQEIINKRKTINFYIKDLDKIKKVINKLNTEKDAELREYYKEELLSLINKHKNVFYKLDDIDVNRALASLNISSDTIKFLLETSKHNADFIIKENIIKNRYIKTSEFKTFFENEQNHFLLFYLNERINFNKNNPEYDNRGDINKITFNIPENIEEQILILMLFCLYNKINQN